MPDAALADAAADKTARAHAEGEADGLFQQNQGEACADGGGERRVVLSENERLKQLAGGGREHGGHAGCGDFQRQQPRVAGKQGSIGHGASSSLRKLKISDNII